MNGESPLVDALRRFRTGVMGMRRTGLRSAGPHLAGTPPRPVPEGADWSAMVTERFAGVMDEPVASQPVPPRGLTVRGWAVWDGRPALAVAVKVNGAVVGAAAVGSEGRPDVAAALGHAELEGAGWRLRLAPDSVPVDRAVVQTLVWVDPDLPPVAYPPVETRGRADDDGEQKSPLPLGWTCALERPHDGEPVEPGVLQLQGWAAHNPEPVDRVDVLVGGTVVGRVRLGLHRPDLLAAYGDYGVANSGFELLVDVGSAVEASRHTDLTLVGWAGDAPGEVLVKRALRFDGSVAAPSRRAPSRPAPAPAARPARDPVGRAAVPGGPTRRGAGEPLDAVAFTHTLTLGGAQLWLQEILEKAEAGRAFACRVVSFQDGPLRARLEAQGVAVHVTTMPPADDGEAYEGRVAELMQLVATGGHNAVLANTMLCAPAVDACVRLGMPVVWAIHESLRPEAWFHAAYGKPAHPHVLERALACLGAAATVVFEAEATRRLFEPWCGPGRSRVVRYGVDVASIRRYGADTPVAAARSGLDLPPERRVALVMGTVEPRKSQSVIVEAFRRLSEDFPEWMIVFVGGSENQHSRALEGLIQEYRLSERVRVEPITSDTYRWYRSADVLVSASDLESLPRSALEAMAFGVPVLSTSVFGVPELIDDGHNGFLFEPNDVRACADGLRRVFAMATEELSVVGAAAQAHVERLYDSRSYVHEVTELLRSCAEGATGPPGASVGEAGPVAAGR